MGPQLQIQQWSASHHPRWLIVLRVALGLCLFFKGISFMNNAELINQIVSGTVLAKKISWLPLLITWANLLGGFLIIIGLFTRFMAIIQIPILIGAVFFINSNKEKISSGYELIFAIITLLLLILFLIEGSGPISLDNYFKKNPR